VLTTTTDSIVGIEADFIPDKQEVLERQTLDALSSGKRNEDDNRRLNVLQAKHERLAHLRLMALVRQLLDELDAEWGEFDYEHREQLAEEAADVVLPEQDLITPYACQKLYQELSRRRVRASALARDAVSRRLAVDAKLDYASDVWRDMTIFSVEWRAEASGARFLQPLANEAVRAKRHDRFCNACLESISATLLELHWMLENYDRLETGQTKRPTD